jgi:polyisoprenoid-binding protein YceI
LLAALILGFVLNSPLLAQDVAIELDPAQTHIEFSLTGTVHTTHGTFKLKRGTIRFDPGTGKASGLVVVDVTSGDTGSGARDKKMHKDVLQSEKYPEATFAPAQIKGSVDPKADSQVAVSGIFNLHGSDHEITLTFQVHPEGGHLKASTKFEVPYQDWGMKNPSNFLLHVSDKVDVEVQAVGQLASAGQH